MLPSHIVHLDRQKFWSVALKTRGTSVTQEKTTEKIVYQLIRTCSPQPPASVPPAYSDPSKRIGATYRRVDLLCRGCPHEWDPLRVFSSILLPFSFFFFGLAVSSTLTQDPLHCDLVVLNFLSASLLLTVLPDTALAVYACQLLNGVSYASHTAHSYIRGTLGFLSFAERWLQPLPRSLPPVILYLYM